MQFYSCVVDSVTITTKEEVIKIRICGRKTVIIPENKSEPYEADLITRK